MRRSSVRHLLLGLALLALVSAFSATAIAGQATPGSGSVAILGPDEPYGGATRAEWDARYWQWSVSFPTSIHPGLDPTGAACGYGQSGPVFFLPPVLTPPAEDGSLPVPTCVVPEGTAIYLSPISSECSTVEPEPFFGRDEADLRACATESSDLTAEVTASIDGVDVGDLSDYRTVTGLFTLTFPDDNYFDVPPGVAQSVADGYSFIIPPPPPGEYEISATSTDVDGSVPFAGSFRVRVVAPQIIEPGATPEATPDATPTV